MTTVALTSSALPKPSRRRDPPPPSSARWRGILFWIFILDPGHVRRQRHQDRFRVAAGFQAEQCAAVVKQIKFHIASAFDLQGLSVFFGPRSIFSQGDDIRIGPDEGAADILSEREIRFPVSGIEVVVKDSADTPGFGAVGQVKVFVAPVLVFWDSNPRAFCRRRLSARRGRPGYPRRWERSASGPPAAEPTLRGDDHPGVHMRRRDMGVAGGWSTTEMPEAQKRGSSPAPGMFFANSSENFPQTVETLTPAFSNTPPFKTPMTPPPPPGPVPPVFRSQDL